MELIKGFMNKPKLLDKLRYSVELEVEFPNKEDSWELIKKHRVIPGWALDSDGCFDDQTLILTKTGWKLFKNLQENEEVLSLNPVTKTANYFPIKEKIEKDYQGKLYNFEDSRFQFTVSPNHWLYINTGVGEHYIKAKDYYDRVKELMQGEFEVLRTFIWKGKRNKFKTFIIEDNTFGKSHKTRKYSIDMIKWLKFLGWYISEGYCDGKQTTTIVQSINSKYNKHIRELLKKLPFKYQIRKCYRPARFMDKEKKRWIKENWSYHYDISDSSLAKELSKYGLGAKNKKIPEYLRELNPFFLKLFLKYYGYGDGHLRKEGEWEYCTASKELAYGIQELILKSGGYACIRPTHKVHYLVRTYKSNNNFHGCLTKHLKEIDYKGKIYCVNVEPYHLIYTMKNGSSCWSGNSLENGAEYRPKDKNKLYWNKDSIDQIKEIIGLIKAHKGHIDNSCGLHVHVDMSNFTEREIVSIVKAFYKNQNKIFKQFNTLENRKESATQPLPSSALKLNSKVINKIKTNGLEYDVDNPYFVDRHYALNLQALNAHGTLEFRLFNGSIQIRKIKECIKFCLEFCLKNYKK